MIDYRDYFDEEKGETPYRSGAEHMQECMQLLNMLLESYLIRKMSKKEEKTFFRGMMLSQAQVSGYLQISPLIRQDYDYDRSLEQQIQAGITHMEHRVKQTGNDVRLPIERIRITFGLSLLEQLALILALASSFHMKYARLYAFAQDDVNQKMPTSGLLDTLYGQITEHPEDMVTTLEKGALYPLILEPDTLQNHFQMMKILKLQPYIWSYIQEEITAGNRTEHPEEKETTAHPIMQSGYFSYLTHFYKTVRQEEDVYLYLEGNHPEDGVLLLEQVARKANVPCYKLDMAELDQDKTAFCMQMLKILFEHRLSHGIIICRNSTDDRLQNAVFDQMLTACKENHSLYFVGGKTKLLQFHTYPLIKLEIGAGSVAERIAYWHYFAETAYIKNLPFAQDIHFEEIASCYALGFGRIRDIVRQVMLEGRSEGTVEISHSRLVDVLIRANQANFGEKARFVKANYSWDDLEIQDAQREVLKTACFRYKLKNQINESWGLEKKNSYGNGISILLYGPPGTGKTMAAQVISGEVGIPLYRIDLSQLFSKYIGETEKNLAQIFDEAEHANAILFFDEADALFSRRTEIGSSNDKHANTETAYLLQKIEEYNGMSILATNLYHNFDKAFLRRLTYAVRFEQPDEDTRYRLWTSILPKEVPIEQNLDFSYFASEFELSGSNIKAILYSAAYLAAIRNKSLGAEELVRAMKSEYEKLGIMFDNTKLGKYAAYIR